MLSVESVVLVVAHMSHARLVRDRYRACLLCAVWRAAERSVQGCKQGRSRKGVHSTSNSSQVQPPGRQGCEHVHVSGFCATCGFHVCTQYRLNSTLEFSYSHQSGLWQTEAQIDSYIKINVNDSK